MMGFLFWMGWGGCEVCGFGEGGTRDSGLGTRDSGLGTRDPGPDLPESFWRKAACRLRVGCGHRGHGPLLQRVSGNFTHALWERPMAAMARPGQYISISATDIPKARHHHPRIPNPQPHLKKKTDRALEKARSIRVADEESACKPGSVRPKARQSFLWARRHRRAQATYPGATRATPNAPLFGLAPGGVYRATRRCPRARCALTAPFHPCHAHPEVPFGGLLSVALAVSSHCPGVTWHPALRSPDFPRCARHTATVRPTPRLIVEERGARGEGRAARAQARRTGNEPDIPFPDIPT